MLNGKLNPMYSGVNKCLQVVSFWLATFTCCVFAQQAAGQESGFVYGTRLAIGEAKLEESSLTDLKGKLFIGGGVGSEYRFNRLLSLMADFMITSKGGVGEGFTEESTTTGGVFGGSQTVRYDFEERVVLLDVEIPIMLRLGYASNDFSVGVFAGPGINFNLLGVSSRTYENENYNQDNGYTSREIADRQITNYSATVGAGIGVSNSNGEQFYLDIRRSTGLNSVGEVYDGETIPGYFAISIAYTL